MIGAWLALNIPQDLESLWTHLIELLGDVGHVKSHFGPFGDSIKTGAWFAPNVSLDQKSLWMHPMVLLGNEARVEARFGPFGYSANLDAR
jgi:hypothetical protein